MCIRDRCIYGLMEDFLISSIVNPFLLLAVYAVYSMLEERKRSVKEKRVENACCNNN